SAGAALRRSQFLDIEDALFDNAFSLNVKGTFYCMQAILPHMLKNGHGVIVNMASMAHRRGGRGSPVHYAAAHGAGRGMTLGGAPGIPPARIPCLAGSARPVPTPRQKRDQAAPE